MKITNKTTKPELVAVLANNKAKVNRKDKTLSEQIAYALKMFRDDATKVTKRDLTELVRDTMTLLGDKFVEPVLAQENETPKEEPKTEETPKETSKKSAPKAENAVKKTPAKGKKTEEPKEEPTEEQKTEAPTSKKPSKGKKSAEKADGVKFVEDKGLQIAVEFPKSVGVGEVEYVLAEDITTMEQLHEALEKDEEIVFAFYWTKRHLKQFTYNAALGVAPKSFPDDLDLCTAIYCSDEFKVAYAISMYTEGCYIILPEDLKVAENNVRIAGGIEYQLYRAK